jgi:hypothetical protein
VSEDNSGPRYILKIPTCEPIEIKGWEKMDAGERNLALCFAVAEGLGAAAGLDLMTIQHLSLCREVPHLAPLAERNWSAAKRDFLRECAQRGFVRSDEDRALFAVDTAGGGA